MTQNLLTPAFIGPDYINQVVHAANAKLRQPASPIANLWARAKTLFARRETPVELVYISDNGHTGALEQPIADQAADEIKGRLNTIARAVEILTDHKPNITVRYQDVASQDTLGGAAALYQSVIGEAPVAGRVVFLNVAPRKQERGVQVKNGGETVYVGLHKNGTIYAGTGPHCFSFLKNDVAAGSLNIYRANVAISGSQFRSRDFFPWFAYLTANAATRLNGIAGKQLDGKTQENILAALPFVDTATRLHARDIPEIPNDRAIATSIDVHGNIKTALNGAILDSAFPEGGRAYIFINNHVLETLSTQGSFDKKEGTVVLSRGSTYRDPLNLENDRPAAIEIFKVGGRVADDIEVGSPHLRQGLAFHVIDADLFDEVRENIGNRLGHNVEPAILARTLVADGYVKGLDNTRFRAAAADGVFDSPLRIEATSGNRPRLQLETHAV